MNQKSGDKWKSFSSFADAASKLLLPLVIAGLGAAFGYIQHRSDVEQRKADRVTTFIKHLASNNEKEKEIAYRVMNVLIEKKQLPNELRPALISGVGDSNKIISELAQSAIDAIKDSSLEKSLDQAAQQDPKLARKLTRIFIQIKTEFQWTLAEKIAAHLQKSGFTVPEIQRVENLPKKTQLRYYRDNEKSGASEIIQHLDTFDKLGQIEEHIFKKLANKVRPRTYELWLGVNVKNNK